MSCRGCAGGDGGCACSVLGNGDTITVSGDGTPTTNPYIVGFNGSAWLASLDVDDSTDYCAGALEPRVPIVLNTGAAFLVPLPCVEEVLPAGGAQGTALVKASSTDYDYEWATLAGATGPAGVHGAFANGFRFTLSATTTDADPGTATLRLNNAAIASVTQIYVDLVEAEGSTITLWLDSFDVSTSTNKGRVRLTSAANTAIWAEFILTAVASASGYRKLDVVYVAHAGTLSATAEDTVLMFTESGDAGTGSHAAIQIVLGDETTAITTGTAKYTFRMPYAMTLAAGNAGIRASLATASTSGLPTFDINEGGASILTTTVTIDANETTSLTAATPVIISDTALADDAEITIDIDTAGTGAKGAKIWLIGTRV